MPMTKNISKKAALLAAKAADSKKAGEITVYDISGRSGLADFMVISSVDSPPQMAAVCDETERLIKTQFGRHPLHRDGADSKTWTALDYGGLMVHVFETSFRSFYALDRLYHWAPKVKWEGKSAKSGTAKKVPVRRKPPAKKARPRIKRKSIRSK
ncbi:MAG: ribosome silencing factor [bacterium]